MKYACLEENKDRFGVVMMCRVLGVARSGYYAWRKRGPGARAVANVALVKASKPSTRRAVRRTAALVCIGSCVRGASCAGRTGSRG